MNAATARWSSGYSSVTWLSTPNSRRETGSSAAVTGIPVSLQMRALSVVVTPERISTEFVGSVGVLLRLWWLFLNSTCRSSR